jgi:hypothetical protein
MQITLIAIGCILLAVYCAMLDSKIRDLKERVKRIEDTFFESSKD